MKTTGGFMSNDDKTKKSVYSFSSSEELDATIHKEAQRLQVEAGLLGKESQEDIEYCAPLVSVSKEEFAAKYPTRNEKCIFTGFRKDMDCLQRRYNLVTSLLIELNAGAITQEEYTLKVAELFELK
jgi:hypothetical protein